MASLFSSCKILQKVKGEATVIDSPVFIDCVGVGLFVLLTSLSPGSWLDIPLTTPGESQRNGD